MTRYVPAVVELKVQDDDTVMLAVMPTAVAGHVTVRPVVGLTTEVRVTLPAKLNVLVGETDMVRPAAPELKFTGVPTEIVKSPIWTTELAEWEAVPGDPAPVIATR